MDVRIDETGQKGHSVDWYLFGVLRYVDVTFCDLYYFPVFHQNRRMFYNPAVAGNDRAVDKSNRHYFLLKGSTLRSKYVSCLIYSCAGYCGKIGRVVNRFLFSLIHGVKVWHRLKI